MIILAVWVVGIALAGITAYVWLFKPRGGKE